MNIVWTALSIGFATPFLLTAHALVIYRRRAKKADAGPAWSAPRTEAIFAARAVDLASLLRSVADSLVPLARDLFVRIDLAASPGWTLRANPASLRELLRDAMEDAVRAARGGHILVSVMPLGAQVHIIITDDAGEAPGGERDSGLRGVRDQIASLGGSAEIESRPGHGTNVILRFPGVIPPPEDLDTREDDAIMVFG